MAKKASNDNPKKSAPKKVDFSKVSQSAKVVEFECSKDYKKLKKGKTYEVSQNVGELLELKGLGKIK